MLHLHTRSSISSGITSAIGSMNRRRSRRRRGRRGPGWSSGRSSPVWYRGHFECHKAGNSRLVGSVPAHELEYLPVPSVLAARKDTAADCRRELARHDRAPGGRHGSVSRGPTADSGRAGCVRHAQLTATGRLPQFSGMSNRNRPADTFRMRWLSLWLSNAPSSAQFHDLLREPVPETTTTCSTGTKIDNYIWWRGWMGIEPTWDGSAPPHRQF
jgi:hypothetical protein